MHCWCCRGSGGAASSRGLLAAVAAAVGPGSAGCKAIDAGVGPADWDAGARGSGPVLDSEWVPTGGESPGGADVGVDVVGGGPRRAWDGVPADGLAVAGPAPSGGDAGAERQVSDAARTNARKRGRMLCVSV